MRKVNTIGIEQANKVMMMAATAYNIKKYLKFKIKPLKNQAVKVKDSFSCLLAQIWSILSPSELTKFSEPIIVLQKQASLQSFFFVR